MPDHNCILFIHRTGGLAQLEGNLDMHVSVPAGRGMRGTDLLEDQGPAGRLDLRCEGEGESQREAY